MAGLVAHRVRGSRPTVWAVLFAALTLAAGGTSPHSQAADSAGPAPPTLAVNVPQDDFSLPQHLYVLPVLLVPADQSHLAEDPAAPEKDLSGKAMNANRLAEFHAGRQNLSVHQHMARRKYETMLRNPLNGATRGTFRLASWDHTNGHAGIVTSTSQLVAPLIVRSPDSVDSIARAYARKSYSFLRAVLDAADCRQSTCPFVFAIAVMGDPISPAGGQRFNHGYNNGGGWLVLNFLGDVVKASDAGSQVTLQSTLLHELGHAFGMPHIADYCQIANALTCLLRLSEQGSRSIMSYNKKNHIFGCGFVAKEQSNPGQWKGPCVYPGHAAVDALPGELMPEDLRVLGLNRRAFPDLFYEAALDAPNTTVYAFSGTGNTRIAGHSTIELTSLDTSPGYPTGPSVLLGAGGKVFPQYFDAFDGGRMWHSKEVEPNAWASLTLELPASVRVMRLDIYSGFGSGTHVAAGLRVRVGSSLAAQIASPNANQTIVFDRTAKVFTVELRAGPSGHVVLRGLRIWAEVDTQTVELYPAPEPRVTHASVATLMGALASIVGSAQGVRAFGDPHHPTLGWHSSRIGPGTWLALTVEFPHEVEIGFVKAHTGHSGYYHAARQVQIERRCVCGSSDVGGCPALMGPCGAAKPGDSAFEFVRRVDASPDELVAFPATVARVWKIVLRTPSASEQAITPGYVHVRGLRFFRPDGAEIFPARVVPPGE